MRKVTCHAQFVALTVTLVLGSGFMLVGCGGASPSTAAANAAALYAVIDHINQVLQKTIASADVVTANKLEAAQNRAAALLPEVQKLVKEGERASNETVGNATRDAHLLVAELRRTVQSTQRSTFLELNQTLAVASQLLDSLPAVKVEPYVAAVVPSRVAPDTGDRALTIYGFLPGTPGDQVKVQLGDATVTSARAPQGGISVELPSSLPLVEQTFIPIKVSVTRSSGLFGWFSKTTEIQDRIYVQASKPYSCTVSRMKPNPDYLVEVTADKAFSDEATTQKNAARGSINRTLSARDLFLATVSDAQDKYDLDTVRIKDPHASFAHYGDCEHYSTRGNITGSTPELLSYELYAPEVGRHLHSGWKMQEIKVGGGRSGVKLGKTKVPYSYYVDAGGTKSVISLMPRFRAARKGAAPLTGDGAEVSPVGWKPVELDAKVSQQDEWSIHVICDFQDGDEKWSTGPMILRKADPIEIGRGFATRVADSKLYLVPLSSGEEYAE